MSSMEVAGKEYDLTVRSAMLRDPNALRELAKADAEAGRFAIEHERGYFRLHNLKVGHELWTVDCAEQLIQPHPEERQSGEEWIRNTAKEEWILLSSVLVGAILRAVYHEGRRGNPAYMHDISILSDLFSYQFRNRWCNAGILTGTLLEKDIQNKECILTHFPQTPGLEHRVRIPYLGDGYGIISSEFERRIVEFDYALDGKDKDWTVQEYLAREERNKALPQVMDAIAGTQLMQGVLAPLEDIMKDNFLPCRYSHMLLLQFNRWLGGDESCNDSSCILFYGGSCAPIQGVSSLEKTGMMPQEARLVRVVKRVSP